MYIPTHTNNAFIHNTCKGKMGEATLGDEDEDYASRLI